HPALHSFPTRRSSDLNPDNPAVEDTTWAPGEGAILFTSIGGSLPGLPPLEDPGTDEARVDLLFQERAYWLFLTGRRHADMRRLRSEEHTSELQSRENL